MNPASVLQVNCTVRRPGGFSLRADFRSSAEVIGLFGPSGSGKTTLLEAIAGLLRPEDGFIKLADTPLVNVRGRWWTPPHQRRVGFVFQDDRLFPHLDVRGNLEFGYRRVPRAVRRVHPDDVIDLLRLAPLLARGVASLSGGEARRVALGRALLASPRLLLLDEPLTGLDGDLRRDVLAYLLELPRWLAIPLVYVSHTLPDFLTLVDHALIIRDGEVREVGPPIRLLEDAAGAGDETLESWLTGVVEAGGEPGYLRVRVGSQVMVVAGDDLAPGTMVRVAVPAHEVLVAAGAPPRTSARNVLTATVRAVCPTGRRVVAVLDMGQPLYADLTPAAARELDLVPGREVHLLLKARGLRVRAASATKH